MYTPSSSATTTTCSAFGSELDVLDEPEERLRVVLLTTLEDREEDEEEETEVVGRLTGTG